MDAPRAPDAQASPSSASDDRRMNVKGPSNGPRMTAEPHAVYITREGAKRLQDELSDLLWKQRPHVVQDVADAAAQGDRSENAEYIYGKKKLREIDRRIHWLTQAPRERDRRRTRAPTG